MLLSPQEATELKNNLESCKAKNELYSKILLEINKIYPDAHLSTMLKKVDKYINENLENLKYIIKQIKYLNKSFSEQKAKNTNKDLIPTLEEHKNINRIKTRFQDINENLEFIGICIQEFYRMEAEKKSLESSSLRHADQLEKFEKQIQSIKVNTHQATLKTKSPPKQKSPESLSPLQPHQLKKLEKQIQDITMIETITISEEIPKFNEVVSQFLIVHEEVTSNQKKFEELQDKIHIPQKTKKLISKNEQEKQHLNDLVKNLYEVLSKSSDICQEVISNQKKFEEKQEHEIQSSDICQETTSTQEKFQDKPENEIQSSPQTKIQTTGASISSNINPNRSSCSLDCDF